MTRCSACDTEVNDWSEHIKTLSHMTNVKKQRQKEMYDYCNIEEVFDDK